MLLSTINIPLISFLFLVVFARALGSVGVAFVSIFAISITFICSCFLGIEALHFDSNGFCTLGLLIDCGQFKLQWEFSFDAMSATLGVVVATIALLVIVYSVEYMAADPHRTRFLCFLLLFTFFMLFTIFSNTFFQLFFGWEGVGLCSYLLVGFWFTRTQAVTSAIKAFLVNRVGDSAFLLGLFGIFSVFKSLYFSDVFLLCSLTDYNLVATFLYINYPFSIVNFIAGCLLIGAMSKSAQIFLHTWLPDAMEGPTPVSALIHAATMVAAGVFLLARCSSLLVISPKFALVTAFIGATTALFGAVVGVFQYDIKKIVAYSTCSQLGYMIMAAGLLAFNASIFHLFCHAFFKALLFLTSGLLIHSVSDNQDIRRMGGLLKLLPICYIMFLVGSVALCGLPFFSGFYSKDLIIESSFVSSSELSLFCFLASLFAAFFTAIYSCKILYLVFLGSVNINISNLLKVSESGLALIIPLFVLSVFSIFFGFAARHVFDPSSSVFAFGLETGPNGFFIDMEFLPYYVKLLPFVVTLAGVYVYFLQVFFTASFYKVFKLCFGVKYFNYFFVFFSKKWLFDVVYNFCGVFNVHVGAYYMFAAQFERGFLEYTGPIVFTKTVEFLALVPKIMQTGFIYHYFLFLIGGFSLTLFFFVVEGWLEAKLAVVYYFISLIFFYSRFRFKDIDYEDFAACDLIIPKEFYSRNAKIHFVQALLFDLNVAFLILWFFYMSFAVAFFLKFKVFLNVVFLYPFDGWKS